MNTTILAAVILAVADDQERFVDRARHYLERASLGPTHRANWRYQLECFSDGGLLNVTGLNRAAFNALHCSFLPVWQRHHPRAIDGRQSRQLRSVDILGLVLHWLQSTMRAKSLCQIFSTPPATVSRLLHSAQRCLLLTLQQLPEATIQWPSPASMRVFSDTITRYEPGLHDIFGFVDGVYFQCTTPSDFDSENAYYNSWRGMHSITNVLVFTPDGCIAFARFNCPGSWHDAEVARHLYDRLLTKTPSPFALVSDTAFPRSDELRGKIITPMALDENFSSDAGTSRQQLLQHQQVVRVRQAAEWGMHTLQAAFPRLNTVIKWHPARNAALLQLVFHLFNYRTRCVGLNQTRSVYWQ